MKIVKVENYDEMSVVANDIIISQIKANPKTVLGLATGGTPVGLYQQMINCYEQGKVSFSNVKSFNLDEYYKIDRDNPQSYYYFMKENLFSHIDIDFDNIYIPNGNADDYQKECIEYDKKIVDNGGIDIQVLGIGTNGHIGFNEPEDKLYSNTHFTELTKSTIDANARFFSSIDEVPKHALTMGIGSILKAKKILLLISGENKKEIFEELLKERITTDIPATLLHCHNDVTVIVTKDVTN